MVQETLTITKGNILPDMVDTQAQRFSNSPMANVRLSSLLMQNCFKRKSLITLQKQGSLNDFSCIKPDASQCPNGSLLVGNLHRDIYYMDKSIGTSTETHFKAIGINMRACTLLGKLSTRF